MRRPNRIIGVEDRTYYVKKSIMNILHANTDVHSRRLIAEFAVDGVKYIYKFQYYCANVTFSNKSRYDGLFQQVVHKVKESVMN